MAVEVFHFCDARMEDSQPLQWTEGLRQFSRSLYGPRSYPRSPQLPDCARNHFRDRFDAQNLGGLCLCPAYPFAVVQILQCVQHCVDAYSRLHIPEENRSLFIPSYTTSPIPSGPMWEANNGP